MVLGEYDFIPFFCRFLYLFWFLGLVGMFALEAAQFLHDFAWHIFCSNIHASGADLGDIIG